MEDCKYKTDDCDNATICPCLLFIEKQKQEYKNMLKSNLWEKVEEQITNLENK